MPGFSFFGAKAAAAVPHSSGEEIARVAATLKASGPTERALIDLMALSFTNAETGLADVDAIREFVLSVAPTLAAKREGENNSQLYVLTHTLAQEAMEKSRHNIKTMMQSFGIVKAFLAYEFVHHKVAAVQHLQEGGALYNGIPRGYLWKAATAVFGSLPVELPEIAYFTLLKQELTYSKEDDRNITTFKSNRDNEDDNEVIKFLNGIDAFIIKYFMAELDEMRKNQQERFMNDGHEGLSLTRGGRKFAVGLTLRQELIENGVGNLAGVFCNVLAAQYISADDFFESGNDPEGVRKFLGDDLFDMLRDAVQTPRPR